MKLRGHPVQLLEHVVVRHSRCVSLRDEDDVVGGGKQGTVLPKDLAHHSLDAVSLYGAAHFLRHGDPKSRVVECIWLDDDEKVGGVDASPVELYPSELVSFLQSIGARKVLSAAPPSPRSSRCSRHLRTYFRYFL